MPEPGASGADANNLSTQRCVLADWEQVFEDVGSGTSWNRSGLNRLKDALAPGHCVKVAALDHPPGTGGRASPVAPEPIFIAPQMWIHRPANVDSTLALV